MRRIAASALVAAAAAWSAALPAAVLQLAPIPVEIEAPQRAGVLTVSNRATSDVTLQLRVFRWTQEHGADVLVPTQDVAVSPPIAEVPAGQTLTVRVVRLTPEKPVAEESFRIWIDELPSPSSKPARTRGALKILMRYSLPVFFAPAGGVGEEPALQWKLAPSASGEWVLTASNPGRRRVNVSAVQLRSGDARAAMAPGSEPSGYVLPGREMRWTLRPPKDFPARQGSQYRLSYDSEAGPHREDLALDPAP